MQTDQDQQYGYRDGEVVEPPRGDLHDLFRSFLGAPGTQQIASTAAREILRNPTGISAGRMAVCGLGGALGSAYGGVGAAVGAFAGNLVWEWIRGRSG